jgi:hypothetical protein
MWAQLSTWRVQDG